MHWYFVDDVSECLNVLWGRGGAWEVWGLECWTAGCAGSADEAGSWMMGGTHGGGGGSLGDEGYIIILLWEPGGLSPMRQWSRSPGSGAQDVDQIRPRWRAHVLSCCPSVIPRPAAAADLNTSVTEEPNVFHFCCYFRFSTVSTRPWITSHSIICPSRSNNTQNFV